MTGQARRELVMSEADWQRRVMDAAKQFGWRRVHVRASQISGRWQTAYDGDPGLPDLILARDGVVLLAELKSEKGSFRPGQREWLAAAGDAGFLWRPSNWPEVVEVLR